MKKKIDKEKAKNLEELDNKCKSLHASMKNDLPESAVQNIFQVLDCFSFQFFFSEVSWDAHNCGAFMEVFESFFKQFVKRSPIVYHNIFNRLYELHKPVLRKISKDKAKCSEYLQHDAEMFKRCPSFQGLKHYASTNKSTEEQIVDIEDLFKKFIELIKLKKIGYTEIITIFTTMHKLTEAMFNLVYNFETIGHFDGEDLDNVVIPEVRGMIDRTFRLYFEGCRMIERYRRRVAAIEEYGVPFWAEDNR